VPLSTTTSIELRAADPERLELHYAVTQGPAHGTLKGEAPKLSYTPKYGYSGPDRFTFEVTDSEGQSASAVVNLQVASTETLQVAIYEPFDYPAGPLDGRAGVTEFGFDGPWKGEAKDAVITEGSLSYGGLSAKGGKYTGAGRAWGGTRSISPSALKDHGLLDDGATLWFSAAVGYGPKSNYKWDRLSFALANNGFHEGLKTTWIVDDGAQAGSGVGFVLSNHGASSVGGRVVATQFQNESQKEQNQNQPDIYGSWDDQPTLIPNQGFALIVSRITWAKQPGEPDVSEVYGPLSDLELPSEPVSVLKCVVDQGSFDTLSFDRSGEVLLDEIRFGPSYVSVLAGTKPLLAK